MQAASIYFGKGFYENRITTAMNTDGGQLKVGLRSTSMPSYYWVIFDNFRLCYYGSITPDEVDGISSVIVSSDGSDKSDGSDAWYTIDGRKLNGIPTAKGIYIHKGRKIVK